MFEYLRRQITTTTNVQSFLEQSQSPSTFSDNKLANFLIQPKLFLGSLHHGKYENDLSLQD